MGLTLYTVLQGMGLAGADYGTVLLALDQPRDEFNIDEQGWTATRTYLTLYSTWMQTCDVIYASNPAYNGLQLRRISCRQIEDAGELAFVTMYYDQRYGPPTTPLPQPQYGMNGDAVEVDIRKHPNFVLPTGGGPWSQWWNTQTLQFDPNYLPPGVTGPPAPMPAFLSGVTKYYVGSGTVWTKVYYADQPSDDLPDGTIQDPGFGFGPSGCYLALTCDQQKENAFWYRLTHYKYSATPWPTQIYTSPNVVPAGTLNLDGSITP